MMQINDIAILYLNEEVTGVTPAPLPTSNDDTYIGKDGTIVGWGSTQAYGILFFSFAHN